MILQNYIGGVWTASLGTSVVPVHNPKVDDTSTNESADMGPVIDSAAQQRVQRFLSQATNEGASVAFDASANAPSQGFFAGPALVDDVQPGMRLFEGSTHRLRSFMVVAVASGSPANNPRTATPEEITELYRQAW